LRGKPPIVLPKGVVCDKCNNEKLSALDAALIEFPPISWMRMRYGVRTKSGAPPSAKFNNARIRSLSPDRPVMSATHGCRKIGGKYPSVASF